MLCGASKSSFVRRLAGLRLLKWVFCAVVLGFVVRHGWQLWDPEELRGIRVRVLWLVLGGLAYLAGWLPSIWLWRKLMQAMGDKPSLSAVTRAYFCGHLGKYIPGKAGALIIRGALLKAQGCRARTAVVTAAYETLCTMGAGVVLAVALAPLVFADERWRLLPTWIQVFRDKPGLLAAMVLLVALMCLPLFSIGLARTARLMTWRDSDVEEQEPAGTINLPTLALGLMMLVLGWACHGLSLGLTIQAVSTGPLPLANWPIWTGLAAAATVIGFAAVFAPGGVGVREGVLIELLRIQPDVNAHQAVLTAVLLRFVWFVAEIGAASVSYYLFAPARESFAAPSAILPASSTSGTDD